MSKEYPGFGTEWRFGAIKAAMDKEEWGSAPDVLEGADSNEEARIIHLGAWMNNSPSGKIYAPWSTNITAEQADKDEDWVEYTEAGLEALGMFLYQIDGELFAAEIRPTAD